MSKHKCPVCGEFDFEGENSFETCEICGWENDGYQEDFPDEEGFGNQMSLNQYKEAYENGEVSYKTLCSRLDALDDC